MTLVQPIEHSHLVTVSGCIYVHTVFVTTHPKPTYAEGRKINSVEEPGVHEILQLVEDPGKESYRESQEWWLCKINHISVEDSKYGMSLWANPNWLFKKWHIIFRMGKGRLAEFGEMKISSKFTVWNSQVIDKIFLIILMLNRFRNKYG